MTLSASAERWKRGKTVTVAVIGHLLDRPPPRRLAVSCLSERLQLELERLDLSHEPGKVSRG